MTLARGGDDIRRVKAPAQAGFPDHEITAFLSEMEQGHHCDDFEKGWMLFGRKLIEDRPKFLRESDHLQLRDRLAVDLDALAEGHEVRRGEEAHAEAGGAVDTFKHGTSRALAVRASDVDEAELMMRISHQPRQFQGVLQAQFRPEPTQIIQELDGFGVSHRKQLGAGSEAGHRLHGGGRLVEWQATPHGTSG
jgi:hypothetical protein